MLVMFGISTQVRNESIQSLNSDNIILRRYVVLTR